MNRYPFWKYAIIAVALVVGILYTVPNFFPEVPAVQVSAPKAKIDAAVLAQVEEALKAASIPYRGAMMDPTGIKVRLSDTDTQIKAKDVLQAKLGEDYIVALNLLSSSPQWLAHIGALPMYLGLDLRGGVHFLLQVDMFRSTVESVRSRWKREIGSFSARCRSIALASPRLPSEFSKSIGFTLCGIVDEPTSPSRIFWRK